MNFSRLIVFLLVLLAGNGFAQKAVPELWNMRVHDDANVLAQETVDQLESQLKIYEDSTSNQIAILILNSLDGESVEEYTLRVAEKWQLGVKGKDNGVLLLVAIDDHKMRIEVGYGLEGVLTDAICSRIIREELAPAFRRSDYDGGIKAAVQAMIMAIGGEYTASETSAGDGSAGLSMKERIVTGLCLFFFFGIFAFFALAIDGCTGWGLYAFLIPFYTLFFAPLLPQDYWYGAGLSYALLLPILKLSIRKSNWVKNFNKPTKGGSGGGRSSSGWGSSRSSWSSGRSSGGFSGGGGSFGGGGSSGSW